MNDFVTQALWWVWSLPYPLVVVFLVFVAAWTALLLHELAHALVARVLGVRVWSITLGRSPVLWQGHAGGIRLRIGLLPLHGEVSLHDGDAQALGYRDMSGREWGFRWREGSSWRAPMISAAGSLANLFGAAGVALYWLLMPRLAPPAHALFVTCFVVNLAMYLNLAPIRGLDGWRMAVHASAWRRQLPEC
jgi:membrane-associated protease RseP (regulator of RpoE activity)